MSGEEVLKLSGVLAVVVLGVVLSAEKTSISPEVEAFLHRCVKATRPIVYMQLLSAT